jgi:hypothetical protein
LRFIVSASTVSHPLVLLIIVTGGGFTGLPSVLKVFKVVFEEVIELSLSTLM